MRINSTFGEKRNANLILKVNHYFFTNVLIFGKNTLYQYFGTYNIMTYHIYTIFQALTLSANFKFHCNSIKSPV